MRRAAPVVLAILAVAVLAGCGGGGGDSTGATVTIPAGVHGATGEVKALLAQFPYQRWFTACVEKRVAAKAPEEKEALDQTVGKAEAACEKSSDRPVVDPNATSQELDLLRADLVPRMQGLAEFAELNPTESECLTQAFEKLPDKFIVEFGNGNQKTRGAILSTIFKTCAKAG